MADEITIQNAARIRALEIVMGYTLPLVYQTLKLPTKAVETYHKGIIDEFRKKSITGVDPVMADHLMAEVETALQNLLDRALQSHRLMMPMPKDPPA